MCVCVPYPHLYEWNYIVFVDYRAHTSKYTIQWKLESVVNGSKSLCLHEHHAHQITLSIAGGHMNGPQSLLVFAGFFGRKMVDEMGKNLVV